MAVAISLRVARGQDVSRVSVCEASTTILLRHAIAHVIRVRNQADSTSDSISTMMMDTPTVTWLKSQSLYFSLTFAKFLRHSASCSSSYSSCSAKASVLVSVLSSSLKANLPRILDINRSASFLDKSFAFWRYSFLGGSSFFFSGRTPVPLSSLVSQDGNLKVYCI